MLNNREAFAAAIMANKTAWSALLGALIAQGSINPQLVHQHLKTCQVEFSQKELTALAEAVDMYIQTVEAWTKVNFEA
ncbi:hypothetical protein L085_07680 [Serratia sp. FS14]|uniref:hypothetical protein n=1 Tax=Serratia sp. (strain FS14) TaxID=1327989 RepID=UPI0004996E80|nr:hypothetical protein [Serratia sp. FS14]AIA46985.1 hypothetical protein L085_07680 [Serratia sp. FS14]